jgi:undecaprenyl diphosphate synthase
MDSLKKQQLPKHIAISTRSLGLYRKQDENLIELALKKVSELVSIQTKLNIPIFTLMFENKADTDLKFIDSLITHLQNDESIRTNKIKVMIIGKWFNLPIATTENIKKLMEGTKDYDNFFLNLLINYDGKEEIISAIKLLTLKAVNKQIDVEKIDADMIKESLYTSYFVPPEILIECAYNYSGMLLWDLPESRIYLTGSKHWLDLDKKEFEEALGSYKKSKGSKKKD